MRSLLVVSALAVAGCTTTRLPPRDPPARELPPQDEPLPTTSEGLARVVITTDVPALVERWSHVEDIHVGRHSGHSIGREMLCTETPCTVSLRYGDHELLFTGLGDRSRTGTAHVRISRATVVVNHALGSVHEDPVRPLGSAIFALGFLTTVIAGGVALYASKHHKPMPPEAGGVALAGLGGMLIGGVIIGITPTKVQEGATTQWTPTPAIAGAEVTAGVRF